MMNAIEAKLILRSSFNRTVLVDWLASRSKEVSIWISLYLWAKSLMNRVPPARLYWGISCLETALVAPPSARLSRVEEAFA